MSNHSRTAIIAVLSVTAFSAQGAEWSDASLGYMYGSNYKEPFVRKGEDITKNIIQFRYTSGDGWGTNFFNADFLMSNKEDNNKGAQEAYIVYRRFFDFGKISGKDLHFGPFKSVGMTAGFDWNTKNNAYGSKKRMLVAGPTLPLKLPAGFLNVSILAMWESNDPDKAHPGGRYYYKTHPMLDISWGVPLGDTNFSFGGYAQYIASKGKNEFGGDTHPETHINASLMYDLSSVMGVRKNMFKVGLGYEYWRAKFGNNPSSPGTVARTPYVKAEYHF